MRVCILKIGGFDKLEAKNSWAKGFGVKSVGSIGGAVRRMLLGIDALVGMHLLGITRYEVWLWNHVADLVWKNRRYLSLGHFSWLQLILLGFCPYPYFFPDFSNFLIFSQNSLLTVYQIDQMSYTFTKLPLGAFQSSSLTCTSPILFYLFNPYSFLKNIDSIQLNLLIHPTQSKITLF